jgi:DNA-directed RNA polymerase subunit beta
VGFYSALQEEGHYIAQSNSPIGKKGELLEELVSCRHNTETVMSKPEEVTLMDVLPNQLVSVAASLIPFLENDDANRALMGSNMQRQAVPLIRTRSPLIGTGMEGIVARDSGVTVVARRDGIVESVDAARIVVRTTGIRTTCWRPSPTSTTWSSSSVRTRTPASTSVPSSSPAIT